MSLQLTDRIYAERLGIPGVITAQDIVTLVLENLGGGSGSLFPIWAEENGGMASNAYEWSWGNGATGDDIGIVLPVACSLIAVTLNADTPGTSATMRTEKNGVDAYVSTHVGQNSVDTLLAPVSYAAGDVLAFRTGTLVGTWTDGRVCAWLREA